MPSRTPRATVSGMLRRIPVIGAVALAFLAPASAGASTRWGDAPTDPPESVVCATSCTIAQPRWANQDLADVLPDGRGVVTGWRVEGAGGEVRLRVLGGPGATAWVALPTSGTLPAGLPVRAGQLVAVDGRDGAAIGFAPPLFSSDAYEARAWTPALADGAAADGGAAVEGTVALELDVEPDADADGLGDETQDPDGGTPTPPPVGDPAPPAPPAGGGPTGGGPVGGGPVGGGTTQTGTDKAPKAGPKVPKSGPRLTLPRSAAATAKGTVTVALRNGYSQALKGRISLKHGRRTVGSATVSLAAGGSRDVAVRLTKATRATLKRTRRLTLTAAARMKGPGGTYRTTTKRLTAKVGKGTGSTGGGSTDGGSGGSNDGGTTGGGAPTFDGEFRAPDGQVMKVEGGKVVAFTGALTLYCTRSGKQKTSHYGMYADDPHPTVAPDGSFAWEATAGYGFEKLKFDGRITGDTAAGKLSIEDRSPLLGTGRIEFDYCFAGKEWSLSR